MAKKTKINDGPADAGEGLGIREIPLKLLIPTEHNPRKIRGDEPHLMELADSIRAHTQLQPGVARPHPEEPGCYELLAGARRWHACRLADKDTMLVVVSNLSDAAAREITVLENLQREGLSPFEEAVGIQMLVDSGHDLEHIAARIGKTVRWIKRRAQITKLSKDFRAFVQELQVKGIIVPAEHLELVARYSEDVQRLVLERVEDDWPFHGSPGVIEDLRTMLGQFVADLKLAPWKLDDEILLPAAGSCTACPKRSDRNPELFDDVPEKKASPCAMCLDLKCWAEKMNAHKEKAEVVLRQKHPNLVKVTENWRDIGDVIGKQHYDDATKSTPGAVPALMMSGAKEGKLVYVKLDNSASKAAGAASGSAGKAGAKPAGKPLAERRAMLENRRKALAIQMLVERIEQDDRPPASWTIEKALAILIVFGTHERHSYSNTKQWNDLTIEEVTPAPTLIHDALTRVRDVFFDRLRIYQTSEAAAKWKEAIQVAHLFEINLDLIKAEADDEIPEPKAWAKEDPPAPAKKGKPKVDRKKAAAADDSAGDDAEDLEDEGEEG